MSAKACTKCGETKPLAEFRVDKRHIDGLHSWCRACAAIFRRARYLKGERRSESKATLQAEQRRAKWAAIAAKNAEGKR